MEEKVDSQEMEFETVQLEQLGLSAEPEGAEGTHILVQEESAGDQLAAEGDLIRCTQCERSYKSRDGLRSHMRKAHRNNTTQQKASLDQVCLEVDCNAAFHSKADLCSHLENVHNIQLDQLSTLFPSIPRFYAWMEEYQETTGTRFVRTCGSKQFARTGTRMQFMCHRSGKCRGKNTMLRLRKERAHGPVKLGIQCVLHLRVLERPNGSVEVEGCVSHYGHTVEEQFMSLLPSHRCRIARFIHLGQPAHKVAELLKQLTYSASPLARLSSADVRNIEQCFGKQFTESVAVSMFAEVGRILENSPNMVLVHKPSEAEVEGLDPAEFYAVILTPQQLEMFQRYSARIAAVCADAVQQFSFSIVTLNCYVRAGEDGPLVFPLAWFITSSSEPQLYIQTFYYAVVGHTGKFNCDMFFSDDHDEYFVNFLHTFGRGKVPKKQVNLWQMRHTLELALVQHVAEPSKALTVSSCFDGLFKSPITVEEFSRNLARLQDVLVTENIPRPFVDLFDTVFVNRSLLWAPCYMGGDCATIYREFEQEHTTMTLYLDHMLMNRWGSKIVDGLISYNSPYNISSRTNSNPTPDETEVQATSKFVHRTPDGDFTVVHTGKSCQSGCESRCSCCYCIHEFSCSCWWELGNQVCDHIHAIVDYLQRSNHPDAHAVAPVSEPLSYRLPQHAEKLDLLGSELARLKETLQAPETDESFRMYMGRLRSLQNVVSGLISAAEAAGSGASSVDRNHHVVQMENRAEHCSEKASDVQSSMPSEVEAATGSGIVSELTMTHNPQMVTVAPLSKVHVIVPRNVVVDTVPQAQMEQWAANIRLHQEQFNAGQTGTELVRVVLSNAANTPAALLLSSGERAKFVAMGKRASDVTTTRVVKVIRASRE
ncbi:uncharacterized protein LOC111259425 [Varroa jacobsoni]|uniref:C2H2-type domain-containing protein n=1 Tax=Varroa destructor TaxID=109461 RepID=A0A7M7KNE0_VARDE|nr:uncharacterized protein LOC111253795 [Varroa destructor]XP_022687162.1 uncharacterized protein LOC111259425 [Varroa jacobsoni]